MEKKLLSLLVILAFSHYTPITVFAKETKDHAISSLPSKNTAISESVYIPNNSKTRLTKAIDGVSLAVNVLAIGVGIDLFLVGIQLKKIEPGMIGISTILTTLNNILNTMANYRNIKNKIDQKLWLKKDIVLTFFSLVSTSVLINHTITTPLKSDKALLRGYSFICALSLINSLGNIIQQGKEVRKINRKG